MKFITEHLSKQHEALVKVKTAELFPEGLGLNGRVGQCLRIIVSLPCGKCKA